MVKKIASDECKIEKKTLKVMLNRIKFIVAK